jgi:hypothetical protein
MSSYNQHVDRHDINDDYVSEATLPIGLNGTVIKCCLVPAMGGSDLCCSTIVNIGPGNSITYNDCVSY